MPIYMDRHNVPETITAEIVAHMHQQDLKVQHLYNCRALTYWFDEKRKTAFCLIETPHLKNIEEMHHHAHGQVPHEIIEVDAKLVESFLGRIEDPAADSETDLNIIRDPTFRIILVMKFYRFPKAINSSGAIKPDNEKNEVYLAKLIDRYSGSTVKHNLDGLLLSFKSVSNALNCAVELQTHWPEFSKKIDGNELRLNIGISAGVPVSGNKEMFKSTIMVAERLCEFAEDRIFVTSEVKDLFMNENSGSFLEDKSVKALNLSEEQFMNKLMDFIGLDWYNSELRVEHFNVPLGYSKSGFYRKMIDLIGLPPAAFLKNYRLTKALTLIHNQQHNISEIAFDTGFGSLSYFSKCFRKRYGIIPSDYLRSIAN